MVTKDDTPVFHTRVELTHLTSDNDGLASSDPFPRYGDTEVRDTNSEGEVLFGDLGPGKYRISARRSGHAPTTELVELSQGQNTAHVTLKLSGGRPFAVVVRGTNGAAVPGAVVRLLSSRGWARASTDRDGRALFDIDGPVLRIEEPFVPRNADGPHLVADGPVDRVELDRHEIEFVMREALSTAGIVLRPDGLPLEAALLEVLHDEQPVGYVPCDRKGRFTVIIPVGELRTLRFMGVRGEDGRTDRMHGAGEFHGELDGVRSGTTDVTLRLRAGAAEQAFVNVCVQTPDGGDVPVAYVRAHSKNFVDQRRVGAESTARLVVPADREVQIEVVLAPAWCRKTGLVSPGPVTCGARKDRVVVRLVKGIPIRGTVLGDDGRPAKNARVRVRRGFNVISEDHTSADGSFLVLAPPRENEGVLIEAVLTRAGREQVATAAIPTTSEWLHLRLRSARRASRR